MLKTLASSFGQGYCSRVLDVHNHVVFGVDDGCRNLEESRALAEHARAAGHVGFVATPHIRHGMFENTPALLRERAALVRPVVEAAGLEFYLGAEHYFDEHFLAQARAREVIPLGESSRYVLAELPQFHLPSHWAEVLFEIRLLGYVTVIAHPERCRGIQQDPKAAREVLERAQCLLQLDIGSLVGSYGSDAQKLAERWLKEGFYHVVAGDLHRPSDVAEVLVPGQKILHKMLKRKSEAARSLLTVDNPRKILLNAQPEQIPSLASVR